MRTQALDQALANALNNTSGYVDNTVQPPDFGAGNVNNASQTLQQPQLALGQTAAATATGAISNNSSYNISNQAVLYDTEAGQHDNKLLDCLEDIIEENSEQDQQPVVLGDI